MQGQPDGPTGGDDGSMGGGDNHHHQLGGHRHETGDGVRTVLDSRVANADGRLDVGVPKGFEHLSFLVSRATSIDVEFHTKQRYPLLTAL